MKRHYVCPIVGTGTEADPYRPRIADMGVAWSACIPSDTMGHPRTGWTLVCVEAADHSALIADPDIDDLPDLAPTDKVALLGAAAKTRLRAQLAKRGVDASVVANASNFSDVLLRIGRTLDAAFDRLDVN